MKASNTREIRRLRQEWAALEARWHAATLPKSYQKTANTSPVEDRYVPAHPTRRDTGGAVPSRDTLGGNTALKPAPQYTGNAVLGIATLHKSNGVPVFSPQEAVDIARMRR